MYTFTDWKDYRNKSFYWKIVIKSNKVIEELVDPTTLYLHQLNLALNIYERVKVMNI